LRFTPWIELTDVGVDTNVFNEASSPKRDFTTAIGPASNFWINMGPSRVRAKASGQYLFFSKYDTQRSWTTTNDARWELPLARMTPFVTGAYASTRQRPGYEIDTRTRQRQQRYGAGTELRLTGKSTLVLSGSRAEVEFDEDDEVFGATLANALNRTTNTEEFQFRNQLTPLTTFVVRAEGIQDRFQRNEVRDADSIRVMGGFELKPDALISGSGFVGFRSFSPRSGSVPDYRGIVAQVKSKYTVAATRFEVQVARDLDYSFESAQPYYALTDFGLTVTERVSHLWDIVGRAGWQSLGYRNVAQSSENPSNPANPSNLSNLSNRVDRGSVYGGGVGYRVGQTLRIGFDVNFFRRNAPGDSERDFSGLRFGGSVTYGMPQ
jgi:hypothetical protein